MTHVLDAEGRIKEYWDEVALVDLADYARGSIIRGAADWEALVHPGTAYHFQTDVADAIWAQNITMADGAWQGIGAGLERIEYDAAGYIGVMGANFGVGTLTPFTLTVIRQDWAGALMLPFQLYNAANANGSGIGLSFHVGGLASRGPKAAIVLEKTDTQGRGTLHLLVDSVADGGAVDLGDAKVSVDLNGYFGINRKAPQGRLHGYDSISGFMHKEFNDLAGVAQTIIPNGAGDVVSGATIMYRLSESGGGVDGNIVMVLNGASVDLYDDGTDVCTLTVNADGSVTIVRSAGAATFDVALWLLWI